MYGPPPDCKKNRCDEKQSAKMYPASVENGLRAHDDDPRVPVLIIAAVVKKTLLRHRFSGTPFDCVFVSCSSADFREANLKNHFV
jgi:hypothetical protein